MTTYGPPQDYDDDPDQNPYAPPDEDGYKGPFG